MMIATDAPIAPVISHLVPSMTKSLPSRCAVVCSIEGSAPAPVAVARRHSRSRGLIRAGGAALAPSAAATEQHAGFFALWTLKEAFT
jgi:hypothetical protein